MSPPLRVGLVGLGTMGGIMARTLLAQGYEVWGHDPVASLRRRWARAGLQTPGSNAEVARVAQVLIMSLPSADALRSVVQECALAAPAQPGQIVMETSTLPLADKLWAARELRRQGRVMLDSPISGTATPHPETTWIMYLSGPVAACRQAARLARAFTLSAPRVGPLGSGIKLKIAANHLVGVYNVACAEMVALCRAMGLDPETALQHMGHSPYIGTGLMRLRMPMMIRREYQPATMKLGLWQKDMQVIGDMARSVDCPTPLLNACAAVYTAAMAQGLEEDDTAAVAQVLAPPASRVLRPRSNEASAPAAPPTPARSSRASARPAPPRAARRR